MNHKLELGLLGEIEITSDIQMIDTTLMAENEEKLKSLLMSVKEENDKAGLKLNIQITKIIAFSHITSWQIEEEKVEEVTDLIFLGSKTIMDSDCSHEMKRCLLLGKKAMTNLDSKGLYSQNHGFSSSPV